MKRIALAAVLAFCALPSAQAQRSGQDFSWDGVIPNGRWLYVRNLNGSITVEKASGNRVEVTGVKRVRRGNAEEVRIEMRKLANDDVIICAYWYDDTTCDENGYRTRNEGRRDRDRDKNEISVHFTVKLPDGVKLEGTSVNGGVRIDGATSEVVARTVNGEIVARSVGGPVRASTVNGGIEVSMGTLGTEDLEFETVNGSIEVMLPANLNAELDMRTVNGRVESDFPLTISGRIDPRRIRATIGKGGPRLKFSTVNGSVDLRKR
ncbi:MAG: DUF4097 family beta strand repeat-containing protein [Gemmatimonadaceae bacterium]